MTPASSIAAAQGQCRSTHADIFVSGMPSRRQIRVAISLASGSMFDELVFEGLMGVHKVRSWLS
jgi:hypothetical protein